MSYDYDFSGWATKNDIKCSDGRTIRRDAFAEDDGKVVPLVWQHSHNDPLNVLGHALLENRPEGVYMYGKFNDTEAGQVSKELVKNGDIRSLSIYANGLKQSSAKDVLHGAIREVSLVLASANPGASIQTVMAHSADSEEDYETDDAVIYTGQPIDIQHSGMTENEEGEEVVEEESLEHACEEPKKKKEELEHMDPKEKETTKEEATKKETTKEETVQEVIDSMNEKQKKVLYALIGSALEDADKTDSEGDEEMKHNAFNQKVETKDDIIAHSDILEAIGDAKRLGSMKDAFIEHGIADIQYLAHADYGIKQVDMLFPDYQSLNTPPEFIKRDDSWVKGVMSAVHHTPFSRIKSMFANITEDEARAKGYIKGKLKKEEVFSLLKRTTDPQTIYKKQKMDRDDVADITDFDVISWLKGEMRMMLDEELARAILVGDGRLTSNDDHISTDHIRPIWTDAPLYTIKAAVPGSAADAEDAKAKAIIRAAIKARKNYKGSGNPVFYTTEDVLTDMLLLEDSTGRIVYDSVDKLTNMLRVSKIVTVPVMEGLNRETTDYGDNAQYDLVGLIVNMADYNVGADKGGAVNMFDDFDIDYNQQKYLIETRCSGALIKPYSAIALEIKHTA